MDYNKALEIVQGIIIAQLNCSEAEIIPTARIWDLGADSLDIVEIAMEVEEEFKVNIEDSIAERISTVNDLVLIAMGSEPESTGSSHFLSEPD